MWNGLPVRVANEKGTDQKGDSSKRESAKGSTREKKSGFVMLPFCVAIVGKSALQQGPIVLKTCGYLARLPLLQEIF